MSTFDDRVPPTAASSDESDARVAAAPLASGSTLGGLAWEVVQTILLTLLIFLAVRSVVQNFRVEGASMEPNLTSGQYLLINKVAYFRMDGTPLENLVPGSSPQEMDYLFAGPERGDVVVLRPPHAPDKDFIKRLIGLPGDTILIRNGEVFVNGEHLDEPYIQFSATYNYPVSGQPQTVPEGHYFVLGDNRPNSSDSHLGWFVPAENLIGKAWISFWPPSNWGVMPDAAYAN